MSRYVHTVYILSTLPGFPDEDYQQEQPVFPSICNKSTSSMHNYLATYPRQLLSNLLNICLLFPFPIDVFVQSLMSDISVINSILGAEGSWKSIFTEFPRLLTVRYEIKYLQSLWNM